MTNTHVPHHSYLGDKVCVQNLRWVVCTMILPYRIRDIEFDIRYMISDLISDIEADQKETIHDKFIFLKKCDGAN